MIGLLACVGEPADTAAVDEEVTGYDVLYSTDPSPPVAGEEAAFELTVVDQLGRPIEDLQQSHERMVHTLFVSADLASFQHVHHEDFEAVTADDLREATYGFPITFANAGDWLVAFDYAHQNVYQQTTGILEVTGAPEQAAEPDTTVSTTSADRGVTGVLTWEVEPQAEFEASWVVTLSDGDGDVADVVTWLGADGHVALVAADLGFVSHTHAWFPDMEAMPPGETMPHLYDGPELPFHYVFPAAGAYRMWVQFAREDAPEEPHTLSFGFEVGG